MKGNTSLLESIRNLTNDKMDNINNNYNDIKNNVELHQHLEGGYRELDNYVNNADLDKFRYSNKTPSGRLGRDTQSNAIINTNKSGYESYMAQKEFQQGEKERLDNLESEIGEIKSLLKALAERSI